MSNACSPRCYSLYERLSLAIQTALSEDMQGWRARRPAISSARGAIKAALADAVEAWNEMHPDALQRLPPELAHCIFRELEFHDRIAVSHVSRGWRATALADPFLWNAAVFIPQRLPVYYPRPGCRSGDSAPKNTPRSQPPPRKDILCELLARSDPVPFSFSWETEQLPEDILAIMLRNLHRMQTLAVDLSARGYQRFFAVRAPELLSLTCTRYTDDFEIPACWDAPSLQKLRLTIVRVPADGKIARLASVTHFKCFELNGLEQRGVSLFDIFPVLRSLDITIFRPEMLPCLSNPPTTLSVLKLGTNDSPPIDYAPLLAACRPCLLRLASVAHLAPVVSLFTSLVRGTWAMDIHHTGSRVGLASDDGNISFSAFPEESFSFTREPHLASYFRRHTLQPVLIQPFSLL